MHGWNEVTIGDVCSKPQYGWTTKARTDGGDVRLLRTTDITSGQIDWATVPFCTEAPPDLEKYLVRENDIVISRAGSVGMSHLIAGVESAVFASYLIRFRPGPRVLPKYLSYFLKSPGYWKQIADNTSGIAIPNVNASKLQEVRLPLAPLAEQHAIVAEVEKQISRLDEAVANLQRVKANLKRYKASVLKAAVEGRLVPVEAELARGEGRSFETGAQLLQRILEARHRCWKGKYESPATPSCPVDVVLPEGWTWVTVSQGMRERIVNGLSIKESTTPTEVRALRLSAMRDDGLDFDDFRYLPIEAAKVEDIAIRESDFFVARGNGSLELVGRGSTATRPPFAVIFPDTMMRIRFTAVADINPWFQALWSTRLVRKQIEKRVKTTAGIYKMAQPELASITMPLPPLAEQVRVVAEVDRRLSMIREVEIEVDGNLKRAQSLRQATLGKAFGGPHE
jgi:type I restriction enzyme S subunit